MISFCYFLNDISLTLQAESYNGLVRLLRPGCRTIVLIVDKTTKDNLVPKFFRMAWPYRRNKTLTFAYMFIEKGLPWFHNILKQTSEKEEKHEINPKNVKGTILALNGHRKYFCMFHAKHPEGKRSKLIERNAG
jgi:DnaJ family protein C protein 16